MQVGAFKTVFLRRVSLVRPFDGFTVSRTQKQPSETCYQHHTSRGTDLPEPLGLRELEADGKPGRSLLLWQRPDPYTVWWDGCFHSVSSSHLCRRRNSTRYSETKKNQRLLVRPPAGSCLGAGPPVPAQGPFVTRRSLYTAHSLTDGSCLVSTGRLNCNQQIIK